jgi:predicted transcriptional regulator
MRTKTIKEYTIYLIKDLALKKYTNKEIAEHLGISEQTANTYLKNALFDSHFIQPIKKKIQKSLTDKEVMQLLLD